MARPSLMDGIPQPAAKVSSPASHQRRNTALGLISVALIIAAGATYYIRSTRTPARQPESVQDADAKLRADLESKNPPPAPVVEPVEAGEGRKIQR